MRRFLPTDTLKTLAWEVDQASIGTEEADQLLLSYAKEYLPKIIQENLILRNMANKLANLAGSLSDEQLKEINDLGADKDRAEKESKRV